METVILFHKDLITNFSARDIYTLAKYHGLEAPLDDLRWLIAIKHAEQKAQMVPGQLTGDPYLNIELIKHLDDESLDSICTTRRDLAWSCEEVWKERARAIDPKATPAIRQNWRQLAIRLGALKRLRDWLQRLGQNYSVDELINLKNLHLVGKQLTDLPRELAQLTNLQSLNLDGNQLTEIPTELGKLTNLQSISFIENQLTAVPREIGQLTDLRYLGLVGNNLTEIPREIDQLGNLQRLTLDRNRLTEIPRELGQLSNLQELVLTNNQLRAVPRELGKLTNLLNLYLNNNQLTEIPSEISKLTNLFVLNLAGNPLAENMPQARPYFGQEETQQALDIIRQAGQ